MTSTGTVGFPFWPPVPSSPPLLFALTSLTLPVAKPTTVKDVTSALENVDKTLQTVVNLMTLWVDPKSILRPIKGKLFTNIHNAVARWTLRLSILTWVQKADRKKVRDLCQARKSSSRTLPTRDPFPALEAKNH